jgi:hypothetical protein
MENLKILESLFDSKKLRILKLFLQDKEKQFYLREIAANSKVPVASAFRIIRLLVELKLVDIIKVHKFKLYRLARNENTSFLDSFLKEGKRIVQYFVDKIKKIPQLDAVVLHGKETEEKANVLLIGQGIDPYEVKKICASIKEQYNFVVSALALTQEQFAQMSTMGLYSGQKKILYRKK